MKKFLMAIACLAFPLVGVAVAGPASAAYSDCASGFCFWVNSNGSGPIYRLGTGQNDNLQNNPCGGCQSSTNPGANGTWNDMASSWWNRTDINYCIYKNASFGNGTKIKPGDSGNATASWNDRMSSVKPARWRAPTGTIPGEWVC